MVTQAASIPRQRWVRIIPVAFLYINARHSDHTNERRMHTAIPLVLGGIALLLSGLFGPSSPWLGMIFLILTEGFTLAYVGIFWTLPPLFLEKEVLGTAMGFINMGNLGGFLGPFLIGYLFTLTGSNLSGIVVLCISLVLAGLMLTVFGVRQPSTQVSVASGATD